MFPKFRVVLLNSKFKYVKTYKTLQDVDDCFLEETIPNQNLIAELKKHYAVRYNGFYLVAYDSYRRRDGYKLPLLVKNTKEVMLTPKHRAYIKKMENTIYVFDKNMALQKVHEGSIHQLGRDEKFSPKQQTCLDNMLYGSLLNTNILAVLGCLTGNAPKNKKLLNGFYIFRKDLKTLQEVLKKSQPFIDDFLKIDTTYLV